MRYFSRTPVRTFIVYPIIAVGWEFIFNRGDLNFHPFYLSLMIWGYLQYRICGSFRSKLGGGGPGPEVPPERVVSSGLYAYTRNPMYLGHIIFLIGLSLTLQSWFAAALTIAVAVWFHYRVLADERNLTATLGAPYVAYTKNVKRWIPGLF